MACSPELLAKTYFNNSAGKVGLFPTSWN